MFAWVSSLSNIQYTYYIYYTLTRAPQHWERLLNHKDQCFFFLLMLEM